MTTMSDNAIRHGTHISASQSPNGPIRLIYELGLCFIFVNNISTFQLRNLITALAIVEHISDQTEKIIKNK